MENPIERKARYTVVLDNIVCHRGHVAGQAGVVERRRAVIHTAAVALIHQYDIHPGGKAVAGHASHVLRFRRAFEPMHHDQGQGLAAIFRLPVTPAAHLHAGCNLHQTLLSGRQVNAARHEKAGDGLDVPTSEPATRAERPTRFPLFCVKASWHGGLALRL